MSKRALEIAETHGEKLPSFGSLSEAAAYYFTLRNEHISILVNISENIPRVPRVALHPGLYAVARLRGLKTGLLVSCKDLMTSVKVQPTTAG